MELSHATPGLNSATHAHSGHDFYTWCTLVLLTALIMEMMGMVAFVHVLLPAGKDHAYAHLLCNVVSGVFVVFTMFGICVAEHHRRGDHTLKALVRKLERESITGCRVIDRDTNTFTREYFDQALLREIGRTSASAKTFCVLRCALVAPGVTPASQVATSYLEVTLAQILRSSVRASDVIAHTGKGEFTIILPATHERLAQIPLERIRRATERWARESSFQYKMRIKTGICEYDRAGGSEELLLRVSQRCHLDQYASEYLRHNRVPLSLYSQSRSNEPEHIC